MRVRMRSLMKQYPRSTMYLVVLVTLIFIMQVLEVTRGHH